MKVPGKPIRILPTAWELSRGLLRRTPTLRALEGEEGIRGEGWTLVPLDEEWYDARELYEAAGLRDAVRPLELHRYGDSWRAVAVAPRGAPPPRPEPSGDGEGKKEEGEEKRKKVVRIGPSQASQEPSPPPPPLPSSPILPGEGRVRVRKASPGEASHLLGLWERLYQVVGSEPFHPEGGVDGLLVHWGYNPREVWSAFLARGWVRREGLGFLVLARPKGTTPLAQGEGPGQSLEVHLG